MAAPEGNKNAKGCTTSGRPREYDREKMASEMIEWAKKPDSINLNGFCCTREPPIPPRTILNWKDEDVEFRQTYEIVKAFLADRREKMLNDELLHVKAYDLNAKTYDLFMKEEHREEKDYDSSLRKDEDHKSESTINVKVTYDGLGSGINISAEAVPNTSNKSIK